MAAQSSEQLRRVLAIVDSALTHLDVDALLDELLDRIRDLLRADTVAVLLLDREAEQLVAHAARGLEAEVRQGVRLPVGRGFAGRIAAQKSPVILDEVGPGVVLNPILWRQNIRSMLGVPLIAGGDVIGVLHVGTLTPRRFTAEDVGLLQVAADRIAVSLAAHRTIAARTAARTLQGSLLPTRLPSIAGLEVATRFVPAETFGVGGDWYDVFMLPDGHIGIAIGDVAGNGLRAAVVMGRFRSVLRAYAMEFDRPSEVLDRLDRKFLHFEPDELATVLYARLDPDLQRLTLASAGHPPPIAVGADASEEAAYLPIRTGPPICAHIDAVRADHVVPVPKGSVLGFYTDGLIERRNEPLDVGLERLRRAFQAAAAEDVCISVMGDVIGDQRVDDDVALVVVRRSP